MTLPEFQKRMTALNDAAQNGYRDSGCRIKKPTGMATNGGCRCSPLDFADELSDLTEAVTVLGRRNWKPVLPDKDEDVSHRTLKWLWIMDYCKKNGLAPAQKWAWDLAELKWEAAHAPAKDSTPVLSDEDFIASRPPSPVGYDDGSKAHDDYCVADCAWQDEAVERGIAFEP